MTKEEYIKWKASRDTDAAKWDYATCAAADRLIEEEALKKACEWSRKNIPSEARDLFDNVLRAHFGSVEIDTFLQKIDAYPDWM